MSRSLFLFAPGAGASSLSPWMNGWAKRLEAFGRVVRFDYPYQREGRARPDRREVLIAAHLEALKQARRRHRGPVVLAGKSMGSRIGCHAALEAEVDALVCFGYPLRSPAGTMRDEVLRALRTPVLFAQGTRDPLCPLELLRPVLRRMKAVRRLYEVEGGDHSLVVGARALKAQGRTQADVDAATAATVGEFLERVLARRGSR